MSYHLADRQQAEAESLRLNAAFNPHSQFHAALHDVVRGKWGVVQYRQDDDRPQLGWINRGFVWNPRTVSRIPDVSI